MRLRLLRSQLPLLLCATAVLFQACESMKCFTCVHKPFSLAKKKNLHSYIGYPALQRQRIRTCGNTRVSSCHSGFFIYPAAWQRSPPAPGARCCRHSRASGALARGERGAVGSVGERTGEMEKKCVRMRCTAGEMQMSVQLPPYGEKRGSLTCAVDETISRLKRSRSSENDSELLTAAVRND